MNPNGPITRLAMDKISDAFASPEALDWGVVGSCRTGAGTAIGSGAGGAIGLGARLGTVTEARQAGH